MIQRIHIILLLLLCCFFGKSQVLPPADSIANKFSRKVFAEVKHNTSATENAIRKIITDSILNVSKGLIAPVSNAVQSPLRFKKGEAMYSGVYDSSYFFSRPYYINNLKLASEWVVAGIPVQLDLHAGNWPAASQKIFSIRFERTNYLTEL